MSDDRLEELIRERGRELFAGIRGAAPTLFNKGWWAGKVMEFAMSNEAFKVQLFRFVDCLPAIGSGEALVRHIDEYFGDAGTDLPPALRLGAKGLALGEGAAGRLLGKALRANIEKMARLFIAGATADEAVRTLRALRRAGYAFTVDILGEATVSEEEASAFQVRYLDLMDRLAAEAGTWGPLPAAAGKNPPANGLDWGAAPKVNLSVKPTAFYSQVRPSDFEGSVTAICRRLRPLLEKARELGVHLNLDMEQYRTKDITLEVYRRLRSDPAFRDYPFFGLVLQAYLKDADEDLDGLLSWAEKENLFLTVRLVKGAYWDYETVAAGLNGWRVPVHTSKAASDAAFERLAAKMLERHALCSLACASHNVRSIAAVLERARVLGVPHGRLEFQVLYGMAEPVRRALLSETGRVRLYAPFGELLPGISYLVRRLLENTSNESFVRRRFVEEEEEELLLADPAAVVETSEAVRSAADLDSGESPPPFVNHPQADFTLPSIREGFPTAIANLRRGLGRTWPLVIDGAEVKTADRMISINPADPSEVVGEVFQAGPEEVDDAVEAARRALPGWRAASPRDRAESLFRAAEILRREILTLSALEVIEAGKQWDQAWGDVAEAIDFFEYYGREMLRLGPPRRMGKLTGEFNRYFTRSKGVAAVIAPWNFPLAISAGMTAAALVTGNTVVYKPSGLTPVTGSHLARVYREAGIPPGVFNFVPGRGSVIGSRLVEHSGVSLVAFTGSMEVGLGIIEKAAPVREGQRQVKKVIAEMGGKNAVIVDEDADLDEAISQVLASAFGYQGQKCSACSRVIVLEAVCEVFTRRLVEAARSVGIGPAEDPAAFMGPVIDGAAREKILRYVELGRREGRELLVRDERPGPGFYVPLAIFGDILPDHRLAQEEVFGPVLSVMTAEDFGQALEWANATPYALTGAVFSRSPRHLELAEQEFAVGNLYLNRGCTGALVGRQPFGGFAMSGVGSKAGGPDYLLQFVDPRSLSENTMRRGFAPSPEGD